MIIGIGTDIVEIVRIKKAVEKWGKRFLDRIYTADETSYCFLKKNPFPCLSGRFAAKEAAIKAFSFFSESKKTGLHHENSMNRLSLKDCEIMNRKNGMPYIVIKNPCFSLEKIKIHLTISHERFYTVATVVIEMVEN